MKKIFGNRYVQTVGALFMALVFTLAGQLLGDVLARPLYNSGNDAIVFAGKYASFIGIWIVVIAWCLIWKKNRKYFTRLGRGGAGNNLKTILALGPANGICLNLLVAFAAMLHGDIHLSFSEFNPLMILLFAVTIAIQSGAEELVCRFYLYRKIEDLFPEHPLAPIIINACFFSALHLLNPGVTALAVSNIVLVGVQYALIIYYFDSFWACVVAHASWNFCQNILLGLPNSGIVSAYSVFKLDAAAASNSFAYNVNFGIEGTVMSSAVLAAACVVIVIIGRRRKAAISAAI